MDEISGERANTDIYDKSTRNRRKRPKKTFHAEDEGKWRPYWQRGHTTLDEVNEKLRENNMRNPKFLLRKNVSRKTKLYHSNLDLSSFGSLPKKVKISKSVSMQGLHRMPPIDSAPRERKTNTNKLSRTNSHLNLPVLEPDIELTGGMGSRDNSAGTSARISSRTGRTSGMHERDEEIESSSGEDEVYLSDDDPVVSRKNLDKAGDYIVEHDWILKEQLAKEARQVKSLHNKVNIILPDEDPLETIKSRMSEINMMVKPRAEYGNYLETIDPEQKERIVVSIYEYIIVSIFEYIVVSIFEYIVMGILEYIEIPVYCDDYIRVYCGDNIRVY